MVFLWVCLRGPADEFCQVGELSGLVVLAGGDRVHEPGDLIEPRVVRAHGVADLALHVAVRGGLALLQVEFDAESLGAQLGIQDVHEGLQPVKAAPDASDFRGHSPPFAGCG
jgi:hypothetical protein